MTVSRQRRQQIRSDAYRAAATTVLKLTEIDSDPFWDDPEEEALWNAEIEKISKRLESQI